MKNVKCYIKDYPRPQFVRENWINLNGSNITMTFIIKPLNPGYVNIVYNYVVSINGITDEILNVDFSAEDAIITFNSIKVLN